jgi:glucose/arabinose dehydrogenase
VIVSTGSEQGLLGLAFPPNYGSSGTFYICYTDSAGDVIVARLQRSAGNPLVANPNSRSVVLTAPHQEFSNHNGGNIAFGPDEYLYVGIGDGGGGNDPHHRAQNPGDLAGKMLRIAVPGSGGLPYGIPPDNPFVGRAGYRPEIWSFGLRNPWRWSFDNPALGGTGAMVIGDVGQGAREEIDYEPAGRGGRNYGWRNREGTLDTGIVPNLPPAFFPLTDPIFDYDSGGSQAVTGGFIYRGAALGPSYRGRYFFADFVLGRVWSLRVVVSGGEGFASDLIEHTAELGGSNAIGNIASFGVDAAGELYLCSFNGTILRIDPGVRPPNPLMNVDLPAQGAQVRQPFVLAGWAFDANATSGTGIATIHVWAFPNPGSGAAPVFVGVPNFGNRPDIGAIFGSQFTPSGFGLVVNGLPPGAYQFALVGWVTALGNFGIVRTVNVTIVATAQIAIDIPQHFASVPQPFHLGGWAADTASTSGTGINTIHVWAFPVGGGAPRFVGVPTLGGMRPDVAAFLGHSRFTPSGFNMAVSGLPPGMYDVVVYAHSAVTNTFAAAQYVRVTVR